MAQTTSLLPALPFSDYLTGLKEFIYQPLMIWKDMFQTNLNFGCNIQDKEVEEHVLDNVGSYGKQLNTIFDSLSVLVSHFDDRKALPPDEQYALFRFEDMARRADEASSDFQGKSRIERIGVRMTDLDDLIAAMLKLKNSNPAAYDRLVSHLKHELPGPA
jgi:hypothetical protein